MKTGKEGHMKACLVTYDLFHVLAPAQLQETVSLIVTTELVHTRRPRDFKSRDESFKGSECAWKHFLPAV